MIDPKAFWPFVIAVVVSGYLILRGAEVIAAYVYQHLHWSWS